MTEVQPVYIFPIFLKDRVLQRLAIQELKLAIVDKVAAIDENQRRRVRLPETFARLHNSKQRPYAQYNFKKNVFMFNK